MVSLLWLLLQFMSCSSTAPDGVAPSHPRAFLELCCAADSSFGRLAMERGRPVHRVTRDFHTAKGLRDALAFIESHEDVDIWAALPCTPWTSWQHLNAHRHGTAFRRRLGYQRRRSLKMVSRTTTCMAAACAKNGTGSFEWPRWATGWRREQVNAMIADLGMVLVDFDGCAFGVMSSATTLALKPWRVATTHRGLGDALRIHR